jgi:uncharacterized protein YkwD
VLPTRSPVVVRRCLAALALCAALALVAAPSASGRADPGAAMLAQLDEIRRSHGLPPLTESEPLAEAARQHARVVVSSDGFAHAGDLLAPGFSVGGEALARQRGWSLRAAPVARMWMRSAVHRALLLDPGFGAAGVGWRRGRLNGRLATVWVVRLGGR